MSDDFSMNYSPGGVFLSGLVASGVVVILGTLLAYFLGRWEAILGLQLLWLIAPLGAAVAAGKSASKKGGALGRVISVSLFALVIGFSVSGCSDYLVLWMRVLPSTGLGQVASSEGLLWGRHLILSCTTITLGALLGMLLGKGSR